MERTRNVALPSAASDVSERNEVVHNPNRHRILTIGANHVWDAVANKCNASSRVDRLGGGGSKVKGAFQCWRKDRTDDERTGGLSETGIVKEEERLVAFEWTTDCSTKLVAIKWRSC